MSRFIKEKMVEQYGEQFRDVSAVAVVSTDGIDVKRMTTFRSVLRERGIRAMRIHNRLGRRALADGGLKGVDALLDGPSTLVWGGSGIVDIAKVLTNESKTLTELAIRGGISDGAVLSAEQMRVLSELPGREELIGRTIGNAIGQAARVAAAAMAIGSQLLAQIREVEQQTPAGQTGADDAPQAEEPAAEEPAADETPQDEPAPDKATDTNGAQEPPAPDQAPTDP